MGRVWPGLSDLHSDLWHLGNVQALELNGCCRGLPGRRDACLVAPSGQTVPSVRAWRVRDMGHPHIQGCGHGQDGVWGPVRALPVWKPVRKARGGRAGNSAQFFPGVLGTSLCMYDPAGPASAEPALLARESLQALIKKRGEIHKSRVNKFQGRPMFPRKQVLPPAPFSGKRHRRCISLGRGSA